MSSAKVYGGGCPEIDSGVWGICCGEVNQDGQVTTRDYVIWYNVSRSGGTAHDSADLNLDGMVCTVDYDLWRSSALKAVGATIT